MTSNPTFSKRLALATAFSALVLLQLGSGRLTAQVDLGLPGLGVGAADGLGVGHVRWKVRFEPNRLEPGGEGQLIAAYELDPGWNLYAPSMPKSDFGVRTELKVSHPSLETVGDPTFPKPKIERDAVLEATFHKLGGSGEFRQKIRVKTGAAPGALELDALLTFQACDASTCDPLQRDRPFPVTLTVLGAATSATDSPTAGGDAKPSTDDTKPGGVDLLGGLSGNPSTGAPFGGGESKDAPVVEFEVVPPGQEIVRGQKVELIVKYRIADGWYSYAPDHPADSPAGGLPMTLTVPEGGPFEALGALSAAKTLEKPVQIDESQPAVVARALKGAGEIRQAIRILESVKPGQIDASVAINWMACEDKPFGTCTIPTDTIVPFRMTVSSAPAVAATDSAVTPTDGTSSATDERAEEEQGGFGAAFGGFWGFVLAMIGGGLFALVMPCTYPMIPLTISFFTKQAESRGGNVLPLAAFYGLGIIASFVVIGLVVGEPIIQFAQSWPLNLVFGIIFVVFALSFFDVFQIRLPGSVMNLATKASGSGGYLGVFTLGLTLVITSFTCTAPVMGTVLAGIGTGGGSRFEVMVGMAIFGLTLATPFMILALFPAKVRSLPRSGEWMHTVKVFLGFLELAAAFKFFSNADLALFSGDFVITRQLFLLIWAAIFLVMALYLLNFIRLKSESTEKISGGRMLAGLTVLFGSIYFYEGSRGMALDPISLALVPPATQGEWPIVKDDLDGGLELAKKERKRALINFTGFT